MACRGCVSEHVCRAACVARALGKHTWPPKVTPSEELVGFAQSVHLDGLREPLLQLPELLC